MKNKVLPTGKNKWVQDYLNDLESAKKEMIEKAMKFEGSVNAKRYNPLIRLSKASYLGIDIALEMLGKYVSFVRRDN